jgi:hypothetical protein
MKRGIVLLLGLCIAGCTHETAKALAALETDRSISDEAAITQMAEACWIYTSGENESFQASQSSRGILLAGQVVDAARITSLDQKNFRRINMLFDAQFLWRLFRSGVKRSLDEVVLTRIVTLTAGEKIPLYRVRMNVERLRTIPGWDTADPYDADSNEVLQSSEANEVVNAIVDSWTVELDNSGAILVR